MKKTLIALAAVAATGAAMAQSSVTIYGVIDAGFTSVNNSAGTNAGGQQSTDNTGLTSSNMSTNRVGFRGTEDLGGGLKANFQIETSLNVDAPYATTLGDRGAWVGLSGGFGEVRLGREYSPTFWPGFLHSPFGTGGVGNGFGFANRALAYNVTGQANTSTTANTGAQNSIWNNNSITYISPRMAGFQATGQIAFDEQAANNAGKFAGGRINYSAGPLAADVAYSKVKGGADISGASVAAAPPGYSFLGATRTALGINTTSADHKSVSAGVSYDLGVAKLMANYGQETATITATGVDVAKVKNLEVGAVIPFGPGRFRVAYNTTTVDVLVNANPDPKVSKFALGYIYDLSKRTALYATVASLKNKNGAELALGGPATINATNGRSTGYNIGISHTF